MPPGVYSRPKTSDAVKRKAISMIAYNLEQSSLAKPQRQAAFLLAFEKYFPNVTKASQHIGLSARHAWTWKAEDKDFSDKWDEIIVKHMDDTEAFLYRFGHSKQGANYALSFLKAYRPERWGDKREISVTMPNSPDLRLQAKETLRAIDASFSVEPRVELMKTPVIEAESTRQSEDSHSNPAKM